MVKKKLSFLSLLLTVPLLNYGLEPELISVNHSGLGGAGVAYPQESLSIVLNPASSVHLGNRSDVGVHVKWSDNSFTLTSTNITGAPITATNRYKNHDRYIVHPDFGINYALGCNLAFGLTFHNSFYAKNSFNDLTVLGTTKFEEQLIFETITPVAAWRFSDRHTIGIGAPIYLNGYKNRGLENLALFSINSDSVTDRGWDYSTSLGINFGYLVQCMTCLDLAIFYQPRLSMKPFTKYRGFIPDLGRIDVPTILRMGLVYKGTCWNLLFDVEQRYYSELGFWSDLGNRGTGILGSVGGPGLGWSNQTIFRLAGDYHWNRCWTFRAGLEQSMAQVHSASALFSGLFGKMVTTTVSFGISYGFQCNQEISLYYAHGFHRDLDPHSLFALTSVALINKATARESNDYLGISFGKGF